MENTYTRDYMVLPSVCDSAGLLDAAHAFALFMDLAHEHAELLGFDTPTMMKRGLFWVVVRTRVRFARRPGIGERVTLTTWPERPGRFSVTRDYRVEAGGEVLIAGKSEWTVVELDGGRLHSTAGLFPEDFVFREETVWDEPFTRRRDEPGEEFARYTVRSTDIDLGGHVNNAAYVRILEGAFSCARWQELGPRELEIAYRAPSYEGNELTLQKRPDGDALALRLTLPDGKLVAQAFLK